MIRYAQNSSPFGFEDLEVYKAARRFGRRIYEIVRALPKEEKYALGGQMRRAAVSLTSNIAEGYGRHHWQENMQFCRQSRASLLELVDDLNTCCDQGYIDSDLLGQCRNEAVGVLRLLNGYIAYLKKQKTVAKPVSRS